jgi:hypothetical protein
MDASEEGKIAQAASADGDQILTLLHDASPQVIRTLLGNRNLREEDVLIIAKRKNLPADVLETIARDIRWTESYLVRLALANNPKTPLSASLSIVRYLRFSDIAQMAGSHRLPIAFRRKVEAIVIERIPTMQLGYKKALAKTAVGSVLLKLLQDPDADVVAVCLNNPRMIEGHLFKTINRPDTIAETIRMIAGHPDWSARSLVRLALVRNEHTPLALAERFTRLLKLLELRELYADPALPESVRPLVHRELVLRGQNPGEPIEETVFEIDENDDEGLEDFVNEEEESAETAKEEEGE